MHRSIKPDSSDTQYHLSSSVYSNAAIFSPTGSPLATSNIPQVSALQPVTSDWIYVPASNTIYSLSTGPAVWTGSSAIISGVGAATTNGQVVYGAADSVLVESYP